MAKIQSAAQSLTAPRDLTCAPPDIFFSYQISHLGLQKLKPAKLAIGGHRFRCNVFRMAAALGLFHIMQE